MSSAAKAFLDPHFAVVVVDSILIDGRDAHEVGQRDVGYGENDAAHRIHIIETFADLR